MDYFRKYLGGQQGGQAPSGAETVERLCDRVQSSTLLEDRRDAVRALKALSKKFRIEVGSKGLEILIHVLQADRSDSEIIGYALETICNILSKELLEEEIEHAVPSDIGVHFTDVFIENADNVALVLSLLEEYDFHVRWPAVKVLTQLLGNKTKDIQEIILTNPMGVSKIMDLLSDNREVIRNDGLLLLIEMTRGNSNIQKIVAFENAFERLLDIISEEGSSDGGIIVEDCLRLLLNLLKNNSSNQNFFRESSHIQRLVTFFNIVDLEGDGDKGWSAQKALNMELMLQVMRTLVSPSNPAQQTVSCQKVMAQCGLLHKLCVILVSSGVPADVLAESVNTLAEVIRGNSDNQNYLASVQTPATPPCPAVSVMLQSLLYQQHLFMLRCALLYCIQCYLYRNEIGQAQIVQSLINPTPGSGQAYGNLLCGGLTSPEPAANWFAAVVLRHAVAGSHERKEEAVQVLLNAGPGNPPVSLLQYCLVLLSQSGKPIQARVALMMLLCDWLCDCPKAVTQFLQNGSNVPFLISQVSSSEGDETEVVLHGLCAFVLGICILHNNDEVQSATKANLRAIIEKRIGIETFTDKLTSVTKYEPYNKAAKKPHLNCRQPNELFFDYEFTRLFKMVENEVLKAVAGNEQGLKRNTTVDQHDSIVLQYKDLIREQDSRIKVLEAEVNEVRTQLTDTATERDTLKLHLEQARRQGAPGQHPGAPGGAPEGAPGGVSEGAPGGAPGGAEYSDDVQSQLDAKLKLLEMKNEEYSSVCQEIQTANSQLFALRQELETLKSSKNLVNGAEMSGGDVQQATDGSTKEVLTRLQEELSDAERKLQQREEEVRMYRNKYEDSCKQIADLRNQMSGGLMEDGASAAILTERNSLAQKVQELEQQLEQQKLSSESGDGRSSEEVTRLKAEKEQLIEKMEKLHEDLTRKMEERDEAQEKCENTAREAEEFLELVNSQDMKIKTLKEQCKKAGVEVSDDEDDIDNLSLDDDDIANLDDLE